MDYALHCGLFNDDQIKIANYHRLYLNVTTVSELFDSTGKNLLPHMFECQRPAWFNPTLSSLSKGDPADSSVGQYGSGSAANGASTTLRLRILSTLAYVLSLATNSGCDAKPIGKSPLFPSYTTGTKTHTGYTTLRFWIRLFLFPSNHLRYGNPMPLASLSKSAHALVPSSGSFPRSHDHYLLLHDPLSIMTSIPLRPHAQLGKFPSSNTCNSSSLPST
jgi:hypothetical protein